MDPLTIALIGSAVFGAGANIFGASTQKKAADAARQQQLMMFQVAQQENQPFINAGKGAAGTLSNLLTPGADMSAILKNIPGFDFISKLAQMGVSNQGTTTGLGGNTLLAGAQAGTDVALNAGWIPIVNALQGLTSSGVQAAGNIGQFATTAGQGMAQSTVGGASALAAGGIGAANSLSGGLTTAMLLNRLNNAPVDQYGTKNPGWDVPLSQGNFING